MEANCKNCKTRTNFVSLGKRNIDVVPVMLSYIIALPTIVVK